MIAKKTKSKLHVPTVEKVIKAKHIYVKEYFATIHKVTCGTIMLYKHVGYQLYVHNEIV